MNIGIVLAGEIGTRLSNKEKKQYIKINGKECISYVIDAFRDARNCDEVLVVENEEQYNERYVEREYGVHCCC